LSYLDTAVITRAGTGSQASDGAWAPVSATTLYNGKVDYQEMNISRARRQDDDVEQTASGRLFLPEPVPTSLFNPGDDVALTLRDGSTRSGSILRISTKDDTLHLLV
jgi:hypothetical protein